MDPELLALLQQLANERAGVPQDGTAFERPQPQVGGEDPAAAQMLNQEAVQLKAQQDAQIEQRLRLHVRDGNVRRFQSLVVHFEQEQEEMRARAEGQREVFIDVVRDQLIPTTFEEAGEALVAMTSLDRERLRAAHGTIVPEILAGLLVVPGMAQGARDVAMDIRARDVGWGTALIGVASLIPLFGPVGKAVGRTGARIARQVDNASATILAARHAADGGLTINAAGRIPRSGFAVGAFPERSVTLNRAPTAADIETYIRNNADLLDDPKNHLGTWHNKANDEHVLDISRVEPDREVALRLGRDNGEDAIFDLSTGSELPVEDLTDAHSILTTREAVARAQELIGETELRRLATAYIAERGGIENFSLLEQGNAFETAARQAVFDDELRIARQAGNTANPEGVEAAQAVLRNTLDVDANPAGLGTPRLSTAPVSSRVLTDALIADETQFLTARGAQAVNDLGNTIPSVEQFAAGAVAGSVKRGWYKNSASAMVDVFGPEAPRFAALTAALSPRQLTTDNLRQAMDVWEAFKSLPSNASPAMIKRMLGLQSGMMPSRLNNAVRALTTQDPGAVLRLSGPKVHAFHKNLMGDVLQVTNDTWMARLSGISGELSTKRRIGGEVIKVPNATYLAMAGRVRETAESLTKSTGRVWTPAEVQETLWSWGKALGEEAERQGVTAASLASRLPANLVEGVEDFGQMFQADPDILDAIDRLGLNAPKTPPLPKAAPGAIAGSGVDPKLLEQLGENLGR